MTNGKQYLPSQQYFTFLSSLQAYTSVSKAGLELRNHHDLARHMNTVVFHTKMVDFLDEMINETGDLSIYWSVQRHVSTETCQGSNNCKSL